MRLCNRKGAWDHISWDCDSCHVFFPSRTINGMELVIRMRFHKTLWMTNEFIKTKAYVKYFKQIFFAQNGWVSFTEKDLYHKPTCIVTYTSSSPNIWIVLPLAGFHIKQHKNHNLRFVQSERKKMRHRNQHTNWLFISIVILIWYIHYIFNKGFYNSTIFPFRAMELVNINAS